MKVFVLFQVDKFDSDLTDIFLGVFSSKINAIEFAKKVAEDDGFELSNMDVHMLINRNFTNNKITDFLISEEVIDGKL